MNTLTELLYNPAAQRIGWGLIHFLWQGAVVAVLLAITLSLLRHRSARARWAASCGALALMALLPVVTALMVSVEAPEPPEPIAMVVTVEPSPQPLPKLAYSPEPSEAAPPATQTVPAVYYEQASGIPWLQQLQDAIHPMLPWAIMIWLVGVIVMSVWHFGGWIQVRAMRRRGTIPARAELQKTFDRLLSRMRIRRPVRLLESLQVTVPIVVGWLRPVVLLPVGAVTGLTPEQLKLILTHELAHVRRWDCLVQVLQAVMETLLFYHPGLWWVSRRIRQESEQCCDDLAVDVCGDRKGYAHALAKVAELGAGAKPAFTAAATGGKLLPRIRRILGAEIPRALSLGRCLSGVLALVTIISIGLAVGVSSASRSDPEAKPADNPTTQRSGSRLEFRIAPSPSALGKAELASYRNWLKSGRIAFWWKGGRVAGIAGRMPDHAWLPIGDDEPANTPVLVTGEYKGRKYVLLSDKPGQTMLSGKGKNAWGLKRVYDTRQNNRPAIGFELDDRGAKLFAVLTKANINSALALVIDGKVVSAPVVRTAMSKHGVIAGAFSAPEATTLVRALKVGMGPQKSPTTQPTEGWGRANNGLQARLRVDMALWATGWRPTFSTDIRNTGGDTYSVVRTQQACKLVLDGEQYDWVGDIAAKSSHFPPGREYTDMPLALTDNWRTRGGDKPPKLSPGKHTLQIIFFCKDDSSGKNLVVATNVVGFEVAAPAVPSVTTDASQLATGGPWETAEAFLAAVANSKNRDAMRMTDPVSAVSRQIKDFGELPGLKGMSITRMHADDAVALGATKLFEFERKGKKKTVFIQLGLIKSRGLWSINDIDLETPESGKAELANFLLRRPKAAALVRTTAPKTTTRPRPLDSIVWDKPRRGWQAGAKLLSTSDKFKVGDSIVIQYLLKNVTTESRTFVLEQIESTHPTLGGDNRISVNISGSSQNRHQHTLGPGAVMEKRQYRVAFNTQGMLPGVYTLDSRSAFWEVKKDQPNSATGIGRYLPIRFELSDPSRKTTIVYSKPPLAKSPAEKIHWGKRVGGLLVGMRLPKGRTHWTRESLIEAELFICNVSRETISLTYQVPPADEWNMHVQTKDGEDVRLGQVWSTGTRRAVTRSLTIKPGEQVSLTDQRQFHGPMIQVTTTSTRLKSGAPARLTTKQGSYIWRAYITVTQKKAPDLTMVIGGGPVPFEIAEPAGAELNYLKVKHLESIAKCQATVEKITACSVHLKTDDGQAISLAGPGGADRAILRFMDTLKKGQTYTLPDAFIEFRKKQGGPDKTD